MKLWVVVFRGQRFVRWNLRGHVAAFDTRAQARAFCRKTGRRSGQYRIIKLEA